VCNTSEVQHKWGLDDGDGQKYPVDEYTNTISESAVAGLPDFMGTLVVGAAFSPNGKQQKPPAPATGAKHQNDGLDQPPPLPPKKRDTAYLDELGEQSQRQTTDKKPVLQCTGLPPTPKVHMGACFSKVFNGCPLHINCSASWVHPQNNEQHILIGAEEGLYTLNLCEIHENTMVLLHPHRCLWLYVVDNILMSLSGKGPCLYRHDLQLLHEKHSRTFSAQVSKIPERLIPRKFAMSSKMADTKGCRRCCVSRNLYNGSRYLCALMSSSILLMQWYDPLHKFMLLKQYDCPVFTPLKIFEMFITPRVEFPLLCVGVCGSAEQRDVKFEMIDLNTSSNWFVPIDSAAANQLDVSCVTQFEKDTIVVSYGNTVKVVDFSGRVKCSKSQPAQLHFDFAIESIVVLQDSVLAFHRHGLQGRSFVTNEVTQLIDEKSRVFKVLGSDRVIVLESRPTDEKSAQANLYVLAGHENNL
jgi:hypothetical protein